jgi:uncharacterized protein (DUF1810 family)
MATERASRESWKIKPPPAARTVLPYSRTFDERELDRVQRGLVPEQMEDKWFIFWEAPWLFLHRSWTGICIYGVRLAPKGAGATVEEAWANRDPEQYREADDAYDAAVLAFLVDRLLLGLEAKFPVRPSVDPTKVSLLLHHVVGHGRANDEGSSDAPAPPAFDLDRFKLAQDRHGSFGTAMAELRAGRKTTHWIWWVFPQVSGLGSSPTSVQYALSGAQEACAYLADEVLRGRLVEATTAVHEQLLGPSQRRIDRLMGSEIDALKLVSSMTLFAEVGKAAAVRDLPDLGKLRTMAEEILGVARAAGYPLCEHTLKMLRPA